jgi:pilus assembly protein CpaB
MKAARIVVLGIAVAAGGLAAVLAGRSDPPPAPPPVVQIETIQVLVAQKDIGIGVALSPQDMQWQTWPASASNPAFIRQNERPNAIEQYAGSIVRVPMAAGEPVRDNKIIKAKGSGYMAAILPSGMRAISTEISPETGAGGFILPNDRVDVMLSRRDREAEKMTGIESHIAETILTDVRVLAIDQLVQEKDGQRVVVGKAELLAAARQMGTLSLTLRSIVDANAPNRDTPDDDEAKTRNRINTVRFGVSSSIISK